MCLHATIQLKNCVVDFGPSLNDLESCAVVVLNACQEVGGQTRTAYLVAFSPDFDQGSNDFTLGKQSQEAEAGELLREAVGRHLYACTLWYLQKWHHWKLWAAKLTVAARKMQIVSCQALLTLG